MLDAEPQVIHTAASFGLTSWLRNSLDGFDEHGLQGRKNINKALILAAKYGHLKNVQVLLAKGAHVNDRGGNYGNVLQAASAQGHEKVVEMLLVNGADVNAQGGYYGNALQAASATGYEKVVEML